MLDLWHYIATDNTIPIVARLITETYRSAWIRAQDKICTMLKSRYENNPRSKIKFKINASEAWNTL